MLKSDNTRDLQTKDIYIYLLVVKHPVPSLKLTASLHLKMDGWKMSFLLGKPIFRGEPLVSGSVIMQFNLDIGQLEERAACFLFSATYRHSSEFSAINAWDEHLGNFAVKPLGSPKTVSLHRSHKPIDRSVPAQEH